MDESYVVTKDPQTTPFKESWTFAPTDNNPTRQEGAIGIAAIKEIVSLLPQKDNVWLLMRNNLESDYPPVTIDTSECWKSESPFTLREIWTVGNTGFFRRYNDDWNPCVMVLSAYPGFTKSWSKSIGTVQLLVLLALVDRKGPENVLEAEVLAIVNN
jgi:hypothetical protein